MNQDENDYSINYSVNISSDTVDRPISDNPAENIIIVGTAHVSTKSVAEVEETIDRERPDVVAVELCPARYQALTEKVVTKKLSAKDILSGGKPYYFLVHWLMAYVQKKIGDDLGVDPGTEMLQAIKKAESTGDRLLGHIILNIGDKIIADKGNQHCSHHLVNNTPVFFIIPEMGFCCRFFVRYNHWGFISL